jgi:hypothetical protein
MSDEQPVTITWDELNTRKVDKRVREEQAISRNRAYAQLDTAKVQIDKRVSFDLLHNTLFFLVVLGVLGGLLAWTCGLLTEVRSSEQQALSLYRGLTRIEFQKQEQTFSAAEADASLEMLRASGRGNPYFVTLADPKLSFDQRNVKVAQLQRRSAIKRAALNVVSFGLSGMLLAMCLGVAEPLSERNMPATVRNGALGAAMGLLGGVLVSLFVDRLFRVAAGEDTGGEANQFTLRDVMARMIAWGTLGLFLSIGPGVLLRNRKKFLIGLAGGMIGGAIGGALFDPVNSLAGAQASRLVALIAIGGLAGLSIALIENAAKTGWLRVTAGFIAGKQFILYRNPTYIGSAPESQIYLFKDPQVGRRHAALHLVPGGVDLEDLPLGSQTFVNGVPVSRARLHNGDQIAIGSSMFLFQEKTRKPDGASTLLDRLGISTRLATLRTKLSRRA